MTTAATHVYKGTDITNDSTHSAPGKTGTVTVTRVGTVLYTSSDLGDNDFTFETEVDANAAWLAFVLK